MSGRVRTMLSAAFGVAVHLSTACCLITLGAVLLCIFAKGLPHLLPQTLFSMLPALCGSGLIMLLSLAIALPMGVGAAVCIILLPEGSAAVRIIRAASNALASLPSIVYGMFGLIALVISAGWGLSLASGAVTMSLMLLPIIFSAAESALRDVPIAMREGAAALGATPVRCALHIMLPCAARGILAGAVLAAGRAAGETAALFCTFGSALNIPHGLSDSGTTLSVYMYTLACEGEAVGDAWAAALVLLVVTAVFNAGAAFLAGRLSGR
ncbi:MAG: ABC transporter permease subunit [Ruminococcaceae bacterium]|nr:ABC transporter permease subunit [Oscillospiraceae bacterium]